MTPGRLKIWNDLAGEWEYPPGGGPQPGTVQVIKTTIGFADFVTSDGFGLQALAYTLEPGDVLLARGIRVTEVFDDSGLAPTGSFVYYDQNLAQGDPWTVDNALNPDPDGTGFVGLGQSGTNTDATWADQIVLTMADTAANGLLVYANGMVGDGAAGSLDAYIVVSTGIA